MWQRTEKSHRLALVRRKPCVYTPYSIQAVVAWRRVEWVDTPRCIRSDDEEYFIRYNDEPDLEWLPRSKLLELSKGSGRIALRQMINATRADASQEVAPRVVREGDFEGVDKHPSMWAVS